MNLKLYVYRRPNMFAVNENIYNEIGVGALKRMYKEEDHKAESAMLVLYYPERFLNILEQRMLITRCEKAGYSEVVISTQSVFIIQTADSEDVRIIADKEISESENPFKLSNDYSGLPDDTGLGLL